MCDDRRMVGSDVRVVRLLDGDGHEDGLVRSVYRWSGSDGWAHGLVHMVEGQSDDVGQPDG